jgi:site-specific recombinase XerD
LIIENINTKKFYKSTLEKIEVMEQMYKKDIFEFNSKKQILDLISVLDCSTVKSIITKWSPILRYIKWSILEGYADPIIYGLFNVSKDDLLSNVSKIKFKRRFINNREELYELTDKCVNKQDAVILVLLYEGIDGIKHTELINLKEKDCKYSNNTILINRKNPRIIIIPEKSMQIIKEACEEIKYYKKNGESYNSKCSYFNIPKSDYVIKKTGRKLNSKISSMVINSRIMKIAKYTDKLFLSPKSILQSGMINKCKELESEKNFLTPDDYRKIYEEFNMNYKNWYNLKDMYMEYKKIK